MKIRQKCLLLPTTTVFLVTLWQYQVVAARRKQSDSILEIMNTREIEQILAQRRLNASRDPDSNQLLIQNDVDEDFTELPPASSISSSSSTMLSKSERYRQHQRRNQQQQPQQQPHQSKEFEYEFGGFGGGGGLENQRRSNDGGDGGEILMRYNDTLPGGLNTGNNGLGGIDTSEIIRGDKLLKSSKNALYITRKEYLKKDWCKTEPLVQRIREQGCLTRTFINRFCYGQCNSFYIPKSPRRRRNQVATGTTVPNNGQYSQSDQLEDEDLTTAAFRSCGFCKPKKFTWITVTLRCPSLMPQLRKKRVQRIKQCKCMAEPLN